MLDRFEFNSHLKNGNNLIHALGIHFNINPNEYRKYILKVPERLSIDFFEIAYNYPEIDIYKIKNSCRMYKGIKYYIAHAIYLNNKQKGHMIKFPLSTDTKTVNGSTITHVECVYFSNFRNISKETVKSKNKNGWTPIFTSYYHGNKNAQNILYINKADFEDVDYFGNKPSFYSKQTNDKPTPI